jgi:hypothetical protein
MSRRISSFQFVGLKLKFIMGKENLVVIMKLIMKQLRGIQIGDLEIIHHLKKLLKNMVYQIILDYIVQEN